MQLPQIIQAGSLLENNNIIYLDCTEELVFLKEIISDIVHF